MHLYSEVENKAYASGRIVYVRIFSLVALLILMIACINFMNLATARASKRAKEVGVRKVVGASRNILSGQFLTEAFLNIMIAGLGALLLAWGIVAFQAFGAANKNPVQSLRME